MYFGTWPSAELVRSVNSTRTPVNRRNVNPATCFYPPTLGRKSLCVSADTR